MTILLFPGATKKTLTGDNPIQKQISENEIEEEMQRLSIDYCDRLVFDTKGAIKAFSSYVDKIKALDAMHPVKTLSPIREIEDALGVISDSYGMMSANLQVKTLRQIVQYLDKTDTPKKCIVEKLGDPHLVRDVLFNRDYAPSLTNFQDFLKTNNTWALVEANNHIPSAFWLTFTLMHRNQSDWKIKGRFFDKYDELKDATLDAAAAFAYKQQIGRLTDSNNSTHGVLEKLEPYLLPLIKDRIERVEWIDLSK